MCFMGPSPIRCFKTLIFQLLNGVFTMPRPFMFIETSAKVGYNVKALFKKIAQALPGMDAPGQETGNSKSGANLAIDVKVIPGQQGATSSCAC